MTGQILRIHSEFAQIAIRSTQPFLSMRTDPPALSIERQKGGLSLRSKQIRFTMDGTECRARAGLKTAGRVSEEAAQAGMQALQDFAGKTAEEGDAMLDSADGTEGLIQVARMKFERAPAESGGVEPFAKPEILWQPNSLTVDYRPDKLSFRAVSARTRYESTPGTVKIRMAREPSVTYYCVQNPSPLSGGENLDRKA